MKTFDQIFKSNIEPHASAKIFLGSQAHTVGDFAVHPYTAYFASVGVGLGYGFSFFHILKWWFIICAFGCGFVNFWLRVAVLTDFCSTNPEALLGFACR